MRLFFWIVAILLFDWYVFQAFKIIIHGWTTPLKIAVQVLYWLAPLITIAFLISSNFSDTNTWNKNVFVFLRTFVFIVYFSKFLIAGVLLIDDFRRLLTWGYQALSADNRFDAGRSKFLSQVALFLGSVPFLSLTYGLLRNPYRYTVFREKLALKNLPEALSGLRIIQISDIHSGSFTFKEPVREAIALINKLKPDLVFFTGDLVNNKADEMDDFMDVFDKIEARLGVYSIFGNHDYGDYVQWPSEKHKQDNLDKLKSIHRSLGWNLLTNENRMLDVNGANIAVIGVENYSTHLRFPKYGDLKKATQGTEGADLKLLLSHDPSHWNGQVLTDYKDIAITFSGHTHGMQFGIEVPGFLKWSPIQYVYKQWAGMYQSGDQYLYVNRGLGFLGYPGRVGILPEITCLDLTKG